MLTFDLPPRNYEISFLRSTKFQIPCACTCTRSIESERERRVITYRSRSSKVKERKKKKKLARAPERKFSRGESNLAKSLARALSRGRVTNNSRDFEPGKWLVLSWVSSRPVIDKPTYCASYAAAYYGAKRRAVPSV